MLHITCPSCGEHGKISAEMAGARIKCKKCGAAFHVTPGKTAAHAAAGTAASAAAAPTPTYDGIAVEGLDAGSWTLAPDQSSIVHPVAGAVEHQAYPAPAAAAPAAPAGPVHEYKLLTSRDKIFEGKFDLSRLEEAINHYARQGWTARSMCLPHVKNFQGSLQEEVVVLLER